MANEASSRRRIRPSTVVDDYCPETSDQHAYDHGSQLDVSKPENPMEHPFIESFDVSFRNAQLNVRGFLSLDDAREPDAGLWARGSHPTSFFNRRLLLLGRKRG